ncbi:Type I restriction enzyme EcoKI M protein [subsurface metagenome]
MNNSSSIISKVWSFCNVLKDDGVSYGDYLEQLTYLLFLKMADEFTRPPYNRSIRLPPEYNWESLRTRRGAELAAQYFGTDIHQIPEQDTRPGQTVPHHSP